MTLKYFTLEGVRRRHILRVLKKTKWNIEEASTILKISGKSLEKEIKKIGLEIPQTYIKD
jgi:transcriptional regulator with GAF, ATPase, and Fis domain